MAERGIGRTQVITELIPMIRLRTRQKFRKDFEPVI